MSARLLLVLVTLAVLAHATVTADSRAKRYHIAVEHAARVLEAVKDTNIVTQDVTRFKRDWFPTMSPQEYNDRLVLHSMSIKHHPDRQ